MFQVLEEGKDEEEENKEESVFLAPSESLDNTLAPCRGFERTESQGVRRIMEGNMVSFMGSLVYDWLLNAGDEKLAKEFKKEANPEPLPPNSPRLADIVKHYKETTPQKRKAEPVVNGSAKKAKKDESSSADSSDDEAPAAKAAPAKAAPAAAKKTPTKMEVDESSDDDSSDDEDEKPAAKPAAAKKEESSSDDDSSDEEEEAKPAVKAAPAPAKAAAKKEESALNQFPFTPVTPVHSCTRCEKVFKVMSSLTRHMADKHNFVKIPKGKRRRGDRIQVDQ